MHSPSVLPLSPSSCPPLVFVCVCACVCAQPEWQCVSDGWHWRRWWPVQSCCWLLLTAPTTATATATVTLGLKSGATATMAGEAATAPFVSASVARTPCRCNAAHTHAFFPPSLSPTPQACALQAPRGQTTPRRRTPPTPPTRSAPTAACVTTTPARASAKKGLRASHASA